MSDHLETVANGIRRVLANLPTKLPDAEVSALSAWLSRHQDGQLELVVRNHRQAGRLEVISHLVAQCRASGFLSPAEAVTLAERAVAATRAFAPAPLLAPLAQDLRAEALSWLANAYRRVDRLREASSALAEAYELASEGSGDPIVLGGILEKQSDLKAELGDFSEANQLLRRALYCYERIDEVDRAVKARIRLARVHFLAGEPAQSARVTLQALPHISVEANPTLYLQSFDGLLLCLLDLGEPLQAFALLRSQNHLFLRLAPPQLARRHRWLTARVYLALSADRELMGGTLQMLNEVRKEFLAEGVLLDAALCSLDLALAYARRGESLPQSRLAEEMIPVFTSLEIEREALAALMLYADAARKFRASVAVVEEACRATQTLRRGVRPTKPPAVDPAPEGG